MYLAGDIKLHQMEGTLPLVNYGRKIANVLCKLLALCFLMA